MVAVSLSLVLSALPLAALAGHKPSARHHKSRMSHKASPAKRTSYTLTDKWQGQSFFDGWSFYSDADPTNGYVTFLDKDAATSAGLAYVQDDNTTILAVDNYTTVAEGGNRNSVRISTDNTYDSGLFIADFWAMPHGCSVWPAWWSAGPDWPNNGEIDVIEGVNDQTKNQYTLHSSSGFSLDTAVADFTSSVLGTTCASSDGDNSGCAFADDNDNSFGQGFNMIAGGVYAHLVDDDGIKMWHFARGSVPDDITAGNPDPSTWPTPSANFPSSGGDVASHFKEQSLTLDITICGDWAGSSYTSSTCPGTCAQAVANSTNFDYAQWKINYIAVYQ